MSVGMEGCRAVKEQSETQAEGSHTQSVGCLTLRLGGFHTQPGRVSHSDWGLTLRLRASYTQA